MTKMYVILIYYNMQHYKIRIVRASK